MKKNVFISVFLFVAGVIVLCMSTRSVIVSLTGEKITATVVSMEAYNDFFFDTTFRYKDASGEEKEETLSTEIGDERYFIGGEVTLKLTKDGISVAENGDTVVWAVLDVVGLALVIGGVYIFIKRDTIVIR